MSGLGDALRQAVGLGISGAQQLGQVAAKGLGLAPAQPQQTGMFGAPAQYQDAGLSDLGFQQNPIGNVLMRVQNAIASGEGRAPVSQGLRQQRAAGNDQRLKAFQEGISTLQQFDQIRDKAGPADYDRVNGMLKKRFAEMAGGQAGEADDFYDAFMTGGAGGTAGLLKLLANDAGAQQMIASGANTGDLRKYAADLSHKGIILGDEDALPGVRRKIEAITDGRTLPPETRAKLEAVAGPGRRWTVDSLREHNGELPPDLQLTASEWAIAKRHESDISGMNGMQATPEILERRKAGIDASKQQEIDAARIKEQLNADLQKIKKKAELPAAVRPPTPGSLANWGTRVATPRMSIIKGMSELDNLISMPYNGPGSYALVTGWVHQLDNTAAKEGEVDVVRNEASTMADRLRQKLAKVGISVDPKTGAVTGGQGAVIGPNEFEQIKELLRHGRGKLLSQDRAWVKINRQVADRSFGPGFGESMVPDTEALMQFMMEQPGAGPPPAAGDPAAGSATQPSAPAAADSAGKPRVQYNEKLNKTRLTYPDGHVEERDGRP